VLTALDNGQRSQARLFLRRLVLLPLLRHACNPHAFASGPRQEVDTEGEAEPPDEKDRNPIKISIVTSQAPFLAHRRSHD
jgi:hypothetical protein